MKPPAAVKPAPAPPPVGVAPASASPIPEPPAAAKVVPRAATPIAAVRLTGEKAQFALTAPGRFELGRAKTAAFRVEDSTVSRRHAAVTLTADRLHVIVEDLGAANGTRVNGVAVKAAQEVAEGDVLELGEVRFRATFERG